MKNLKVADYLTECNLIDRVLDGIDKIAPESKKDRILNALTSWNMKFGINSTSIAGRCSYRREIIELHNELLKVGREKDRNRTFIHEIAHLITHFLKDDESLRSLWRRKDSAHGHTWKRVMLALGSNPERCHNYEYFTDLKIKTAKHKYVCKDCGYEYFSQRALKNIDHRFHNNCRHKENGGRLTHYVIR